MSVAGRPRLYASAVKNEGIRTSCLKDRMLNVARRKNAQLSHRALRMVFGHTHLITMSCACSFGVASGSAVVLGLIVGDVCVSP